LTNSRTVPRDEAIIGRLTTVRPADERDADLLVRWHAGGLGPDAGRALALELLRRGWKAVTVDPYTWNDNAVRSWRKAGFVDVEEREPDDEHTARWLLMEFRASVS
jgi:hypothetical protein